MFIALLGVLLLPLPVDPGILVERRLAEELPASVGDTVIARVLGGTAERAFVVAGIFERAPDPNRIARNDYEVRFHLPDLEQMLPDHDRVDRFAIELRSGADPEATARWVESLAFGTQVYESVTLADRSSTTFRVVSRFHDAIGLVTLLASGIFLLCLMVIRVDGRRPDVRTMRLIGVSRRTIVSAVVAEAVLIAAVASVLGVAMGAVLTFGVNTYFGAYYDTTLRFAILSPRIVVVAASLGVALGLIAGGLAAVRIVRVPPQRLGER
ncbi:MAG: FtsX-like permease family protein [Gemmatimonas sp.]|nr:FtsX-like permease family protein [Gemmatimonas sp.]